MRSPYLNIWSALIGLAGIFLTIASLRFVRPEDCRSLCLFSPQTPCPSGACRPTEQRAGFPLPVFIDSGGGSSPTTGWGKLGPEDLANPVTFLADVFFYCFAFWFFWVTIRVFRHKEDPKTLRRTAPLLGLELLILIAGVLTDPSLLAQYR